MTDAWLDLLLAWMFGAGADPRPVTYYVRLLDVNEVEIQAAAWTDYAPQGVARAGGFTAPAAGAGGRREVTSAAAVQFSAAAQIPGANVEVHHVVVATQAAGGVEVVRYPLPAPKIIQNGDPVSIPINQLVAYLN